jgi:hypothetical protein
MSESSFFSLVAEGSLPPPKRIHAMVIWDRLELDAAFDKFSEESEAPRRNLMDDVVRKAVEAAKSKESHK